MKQIIKAIFGAVFFSSILISCASTNAKKTNPTGLKNQTYSEVISVTGGDIRGIINKEGTVEIFAGIPFAAPPVGELRWKEPQNVVPWNGILECVNNEIAFDIEYIVDSSGNKKIVTEEKIIDASYKSSEKDE